MIIIDTISAISSESKLIELQKQISNENKYWKQFFNLFCFLKLYAKKKAFKWSIFIQDDDEKILLLKSHLIGLIDRFREDDEHDKFMALMRGYSFDSKNCHL